MLVPLFLIASFSVSAQVVAPPNTGETDFEIDEVDVDRPGIRVQTSPCTRYTDLGSTVEAWDWRAEEYDIVYYPGNSTTSASRTIVSPFFSPTSPNTVHLSVVPNGEIRDFEPSDGWELLYRNLGVPERPVEEPSYGLYNRLDGRIRILYYIEPNDDVAPDNVLIRLSQFEENAILNATAIFENLNIPSNSISSFNLGSSLGGMVQLNRGGGASQWYILEGVASYDPCLCQHESALSIEPILTQTTALTFNMEGTGESEAVYEAGDPVSTLGYFNGLAGKINSGYKKYKDLQDYKVDADGSKSKTIKVASSLLGGFLDVLGPVSGVTELLGFVLGKKSTAGSPKLTGYNHNFNFTAEGALEDDFAYYPHFLYTPGSFYSENQLQAFRPVYDNPLGVLTLLDAPIVELQEERTITNIDENEVQDVTVVRWRFAGGLRYHINTIAGISNQPIQLLASLVWPSSCENEDDFFATPAINVTCLEEFVVEFEDYYEDVIDPGTGESYDREFYEGCYGQPQLQIVALLTSTGPTPGQEILYSARYATQVREVSVGTIGANPFEDMSIEEINESCTTVIPGPVPDIRLGQFCARSYDPSLGKQFASDRELTEQSSIIRGTYNSHYSAYPNPFDSQISVNLKKEWLNTPLRFQLRDILGHTVWQKNDVSSNAASYDLTENLAGLPAGTYLLTVSGTNIIETITLQKR